jgi:hypothetical protein
VWCGALPLTFGTIVFSLWLVTRYGGFALLGLFTIVGGCILFLIGAAYLIADVAYGPPPAAPPEARGWKRAGAALLLLSNFPAAAAIVATVSYMESAMQVTVQNVGNTGIDRLVMTWPDGDIDFGTIPPGGTSTRTVHLQGAGKVTFEAMDARGRKTGTIYDYIDSDDRHDTTIDFKDGQPIGQ